MTEILSRYVDADLEAAPSLNAWTRDRSAPIATATGQRSEGNCASAEVAADRSGGAREYPWQRTRRQRPRSSFPASKTCDRPRRTGSTSQWLAEASLVGIRPRSMARPWRTTRFVYIRSCQAA